MGAGRPLHKIDLHDRYRYNMGSRWDPPLRGWFQGTERTIFFTKQGRSPSPGTTRLWYHRAAPRLVRFEAVSKSSTVLQVEIDRSSLEDAGGLGVLIPRKNYYRNTFFECLDAGGERPETEEIGVASYDASADGHPFWDFAVSTHTVNQGSAVWGSVPLWPDLHHECLCVLAADVLLDGAGEAVGKAIIQGRVTKKLAEFVNTMEQRDLSGSRFVNLESR